MESVQRQEAAERERKRQENEFKQIKNRILLEKMQQISLTTHGQKVLKILKEKGTTDLDEIEKEWQNVLVRERKELQSRLKSQEKEIHYFELAKRIAEVPLIEEYLKEMTIKDEHWENSEKYRIENAIAERKNAVHQQERLKRMHVDRNDYIDLFKPECKSLYQKKLVRFNEMLEIEKARRLAQRRRDKWVSEWEMEKRIEEEKEAARAAEMEEKARLKKWRFCEKDNGRCEQNNHWRKDDSEERTKKLLAKCEKERETRGSFREDVTRNREPEPHAGGSAWHSRTIVEDKQQWRRVLPPKKNRKDMDNIPNEASGLRDQPKDTNAWRPARETRENTSEGVSRKRDDRKQNKPKPSPQGN